MLGRRDPQGQLFTARNQIDGEEQEKMGFYGKLAKHGDDLFRDEDFQGAYCLTNGRPSTPPSILARARLLQHFENISDAEVVERSRYDLRWKVVLDLDPLSTKAPFAKSTFQAFRVRLTLHAKEGLAFEKSVRAAKEAGLLHPQLSVALDSSPVRGRGAVKDTFNLLSDAILAVLHTVARSTQRRPEDVAHEAGLERHLECSSIKGSEIVDWDNPTAVSQFLAGLLEDSRQAAALAERHQCASEEATLLGRVIAQDVETDSSSGTPSIRQGVAPDRIVSVHDPDMRHGHKSNGKVYNGHKAHLAVSTPEAVITAVDVSAPADPDGAHVQALLQQTTQQTECQVEQVLGDTAYSSRTAVDQANQEGVELVANMPSPPRGKFGPAQFQVSEDAQQATCPAGVASHRKSHVATGVLHRWSPHACGACPMKAHCTNAAHRSLLVGPDFHERRRRERHVHSEDGRHLLRQRMAAEHAIGRLKNLGAHASRYFGRAKLLAQLLWTAAVANLSLAWGR